MSTNYDIEMSTDDTLELDAIIQEWNAESNDVIGNIQYEDSDSTVHNSSGIQTNTFIFDPQEAGKYTIPVNGQELTVKVNSAISIPKSVLKEDLVAWYRFQDGDARDYTATLNATFADSTDYSGTVNGATYQSSGGVTDFENAKNSGAYKFNGTDDFINLPDSTVGGLTQISMMCWIYIQESPTDFDGIFHNKSYQDIGIMIEDNDTYHVEMSTDLGNNIDPSGGSITMNQWEFVALTWSGVTNDFDFYVNGQPKVQKSVSGNKVDSPEYSGTTLGKRTDTDDYFGGLIDDARIYDRALTESEILEIYNATKP